MKDIAIVFGSSRSNGNTFDAVKLATPKMGNPLIFDLANYQISDFDYDHKNKNDDFIRLMEQLITYKTIILATPVYWYTMSASMKRFVDRISDLLSTDKDIGRLLRGKNLAVISSYSIHPEGKDGFEPIFINTAKYLGMKYRGCYFHYAGTDKDLALENPTLLTHFIDNLNIIETR